MPPKKSGRPARPAAPKRPQRRPAPASRARLAAPTKRPAQAQSARNPRKQGPRRSPRREPAGDIVVGNVPFATRVAGGVAVVAGLLLAIGALPPHLRVGAEPVVAGDSFAAIVVAWIWPLVVIVAGASVAAGHYPRLGMAALTVAAALSVAALVGELYWATPDAARGRYEIIFGRRLLTSSVQVGAGWYVVVTGLILLILVGIAIGWLWSRVIMDDNESLDPGRPLLGGLAAVSGVIAVLSLSATLVRIPDQVTVGQQVIAGQLRPVESVLPVEGSVGLLERPGLALAGSLLMAAVLVLFSMFCTTLRPRLAVVGGLAAFAGYLLALAARAILEAARSDQIELSIGGWGILLAGCVYAAMTSLAWRWQPAARAITRGMPMRPATRRALKRG